MAGARQRLKKGKTQQQEHISALLLQQLLGSIHSGLPGERSQKGTQIRGAEQAYWKVAHNSKTRGRKKQGSFFPTILGLTPSSELMKIAEPSSD